MFRSFKMFLTLLVFLSVGSKCWAGWFQQDTYSQMEVLNVAVGTTTPVQVFYGTAPYTSTGVNNLVAYAVIYSTSANVTFSTTSVTGTRGWIIPKATSYDLPVYWSPDDPLIMQQNGYILLDPAAGAGTKIIQIHRNTAR